MMYMPSDDKIKMPMYLKWTVYQESLMAMMEDASSADLIIKCGAEIFRAHKVVLCSRSSVFSAMLQGDQEEGEIIVTDVDPATFAALLHYIYTGKLQDGLDLGKMIYAADKYDL